MGANSIPKIRPSSNCLTKIDFEIPETTDRHSKRVPRARFSQNVFNGFRVAARKY